MQQDYHFSQLRAQKKKNLDFGLECSPKKSKLREVENRSKNVTWWPVKVERLFINSRTERKQVAPTLVSS